MQFFVAGSGCFNGFWLFDINEVMQKFEYDDDFIESVNDDFCLGWNTAKEIISKMLSDIYWKNNRN